MKKLITTFSLILITLFSSSWVNAAADLDVNTPAISAIKNSMQARHAQLNPHYNSGAVGLTADGLIAVRDATAVPLKDRGGINSLVAAENSDRNALYKEIAAGNGHPEWAGEIRSTFANRWVDKAQSGWYYQSAGTWVKK
ncbi:YdbL family protein [Methylotenera versatilis]|uniref:YdbL family protein n=1 Tax=Methylotenera versatilis TaxID=1055487 RepID=UPI000645A10B|nr:YdbL family protein [Methylotenera versatilis]